MAECIEREATIKRIKEVYCAGCNSYNGVRCRACGTGDAIDIIEDVPAADVAPVVHGCFEPCFDENGNWRQGFAKCSNCGKEYYAQVINHFGYCPHCGAKMDGKRKDGADG